MKKILDPIARRTAFYLFSATKSVGIPTPAIIAKHVHFKGVVNVPVGDGQTFRMQSYGHAIENRLYWYGKFGHEPESFLPWLKAASQAQVVLDIGSNTGLYSLGAGAKNPAARIFAFEPMPRVASLTRKNAQLNPSFNIQVQQNAVCDQGGMVTIHDPGGDQPASASLKSDFLDCEQETIEVEAIRIDDFVADKQLARVDLVKLDVEGVEEIALRGMQQTIQKFKPTLFIEVLDSRPDLIAELKKLVDLGYRVGDLCKDGIKKHDLDTAKGEDRNLLFTVDLETFPELAD